MTADTAIEADLTVLRTGLADAADRDGLLDIAYTVISTPVGELLLAATERGLLQIAYASQGHDKVLDDLARVVSPRVLRAPRRLDIAAWELEDYFAGRRTRFDLPLDLRLSRGFRRSVQEQLPSIDYGQTETYAQVATAVGNPRAVRAVGTACATNPLPIVVPCHRVLRSDGALGGYIGGLDAKATLLTLEKNA